MIEEIGLNSKMDDIIYDSQIKKYIQTPK